MEREYRDIITSSTFIRQAVIHRVIQSLSVKEKRELFNSVHDITLPDVASNVLCISLGVPVSELALHSVLVEKRKSHKRKRGSN